MAFSAIEDADMSTHDESSQEVSTIASGQEKSSSKTGDDYGIDLADQYDIDPGLSAESRTRVNQLARRFTDASNHTKSHGAIHNPFKDTSNSKLDPSSSEFDAKEWARTVMQLMAEEPDRYLPRHAGVSFSNLGVHGFGNPIGYQTDFLNIVLQVTDLVTSLINRKREKIQILHDHNGLLRKGEMLLVLGRPGR